MNILVFGGNGYIGKNVIQFLIKENHVITVVDTEITDQIVMKNCECIIGNILDKSLVSNVGKDKDLVYNFAAVSNVDLNSNDIENAININMIGLVNILESCLANNIQKIIHASSVYVLYDKGGIYSITKRAAEDLIIHYSEHYNLEYTILRYGTLYGPEPGQGNSLYRYLKEALQNNKIEYFGDGNELREYLHIDDAAQLTVSMKDDEYKNEVVIVSGLHSYKVKDIFTLITEMVGSNVEIEFNASANKYHYKITPYSYKNKAAKKPMLMKYIDMHQGLYQVMTELISQ